MGISILEALAAQGGGFVFNHGQLWEENEVHSAWQLLNEQGRRAYNLWCQGRINALRSELQGLGVTEFVEVPAYFEGLDSNNNDVHEIGELCFAALPSMVNMVNVNGVLIVPNPNPHPNTQWPGGGGDPFKQAFVTAIGPSTTVRWIDCLEHHWNDGEVHCGTNLHRTPSLQTRQWWNVVP